MSDYPDIEIKLTVSGKNECCSAPWWLIINPHQSMRCDVHDIASMITGPFFSREEAQQHLTARRYAFGKHAKVYCHSGSWTHQYKNATKAIS